MRKPTVLALVLVAIGVSAQDQAPSERFYQAIRNNDLTTLRALIAERGPSVTDAQGQTPLMLAAAFGSLDAVQLLIADGADVKATSAAGVTALHWATADSQKVRLLLERGADVNATSRLGRTPLLVAASSQGTASIVGLLLDKGADVNVADSTGVTPLIAATSVDDVATATLLLARGADVHAKANVGAAATALMGAAVNGNLELTRVLLSRRPALEAVSADRSGTVKNGAVLFGNVTAVHLATASGNVEVLKLLLDAGAAVNPRDVRGMTPLMWSVGTDHPQMPVVRLLLDRGADPSLQSTVGESAVDWARKFNNPAVLAALKMSPTTGTTADTAERAGTPREAVQRSLPLLRKATDKVLADGGCVACHAQPMLVIAAQFANANGWGERADGPAAQAANSLLGNVQTMLQDREAGGAPDTALYVSMMMVARHDASSLATDALAAYLAAKQRPAGNWRGVGATRAPIQDGDISRTAMAIRTLSVYATPARKLEYEQRIARATTWLEQQPPASTEDRVMQLLGLTWGQAPAAIRTRVIRELLSSQRTDGGWAQTPYLQSDAYATGQALYALRETGTPVTDPSIQRGVRFLTRTQHEDGSWYVKSRAMKIQPYFESGFPYGHDQWISQTGTAWATIGLAVATSAPVGSTTAAANR